MPRLIPDPTGSAARRREPRGTPRCRKVRGTPNAPARITRTGRVGPDEVRTANVSQNAPSSDIEDQLIRRAQTGDSDAYGELARRHAPSALRVATVVLGTAEGADDVVQDATERAWRSIASFQPGLAFRPWLLRIVANTARNERRSKGRRAHLAVRATRASARDSVASPEDVVVSELERRRVVEALNCLGSEDRLVIALRYFEQLSEREMAEVLGCAPGTVKSRLARARTGSAPSSNVAVGRPRG